MKWQVPRIWDGGEVWILGGGPSIPRQFEIPEKVIQDVIRGVSLPSAYSPYMSAIYNKHVIGINAAYLIGTWIDWMFFGDNGFFLNNQKGLLDFPGLKISSNPACDRYNWIKYLERDGHHTTGISSHPGKVSWNWNSGAAAISVAANAGAKRIILLGFDMKMNGDQQHWHDWYHKIGNRSKKGMMHLPFDRHLRGFAQIAKDAQQRGIEIINACPESAITQFHKCNVKELL